MGTTTSASKPKAKRTASSASKDSKGKKASGTSRSKRSSSTSTRRSPSLVKAGTARLKAGEKQKGLSLKTKVPAKALALDAQPIFEVTFRLGVKEAKGSQDWCQQHRTRCRLTAPIFTWSFTPRQEAVTLASVRCACGQEHHLVADKTAKAEPKLLAPAHDPFMAFNARAAAKMSGATRGGSEKGLAGKGGTSKSAPRVAG